LTKNVIVDELDYLPLEPDAAHLLFQLVNRRYEIDAMLITSNRSVAKWSVADEHTNPTSNPKEGAVPGLG
jgi:DNA replication protein DnaC